MPGVEGRASGDLAQPARGEKSSPHLEKYTINAGLNPRRDGSLRAPVAGRALLMICQ